MPRPTIVFDLGGVLIDWDRRHLYRKLFDYRPAEMDFFLETVCPLSWNHELDARSSFSDAIAEKIAEHPDYEPYITAYWKRWPEMIVGSIDGTVGVLADVRRAGYTTAALSNWPPDTFPIVQREYVFLSWFDDVVLSSDHGAAKPDPAIYRTFLQIVERDPQDCVFIDNLLPNIYSAEILGFQVIHFRSPDQLRNELTERGIL